MDKYDVKQTNGLTIEEIVKRATENGVTVQMYTRKQLKLYDHAREKDRDETDKFLTRAWYTAAPRPRKGMKGH